MTPLGHESIRKAAPGHVAAVRALFIDHLSAEEIAVLDTVARTVLDKLPAV